MIRTWMPHGLLALVLAGVGLGTVVSQDTAKVAGPWSELEGEWAIVKARKGNKDADPAQVAHTKVVVREKSLQVVEPNYTEAVEVVRVAPADGMHQVDLAVADQDGKATGKVLEGILGRQGDKVMLAWSKIPEKGKRPSSFDTRSDSVVFMELVRPKKTGKSEPKPEAPPAVPERKGPFKAP